MIPKKQRIPWREKVRRSRIEWCRNFASDWFWHGGPITGEGDE